jgi:hypothetical protein
MAGMTLATFILAALTAVGQAPAASSLPVTSTERAQTRPLVSMVIAAQRSGDFAPLCAVLPDREIRAIGSISRCRTLARSNPRPACGRCTFRVVRVLGVYETAADRVARRKTVVWLLRVRGDPQFVGESDLELSFVRQRGRWVLTDVLQSGNAR